MNKVGIIIIESKAFSKSRKTAKPGMFFFLVMDIMSVIILMLSPIYLPFTYPVCANNRV